MAEDKNCRHWDKPYYTVAEAAAYWCGVTGRPVRVNEDGLPEPDPQNPCLRTRAEWIMDAIDCGEIPCGRGGGPNLDEHVKPSRRTVRRTDLRQWFRDHRPQSEWPPFLFDEIERSTHASVTIEAAQALQAERDAARAELEKAKARAAETMSQMDAMRGERDSLRAMVDKGMTTTERNTLLTIIAALCKYEGLDPQGRGAAQRIMEMTDDLGAHVDDGTIRTALAKIPVAVETRMK